MRHNGIKTASQQVYFLPETNTGAILFDINIIPETLKARLKDALSLAVERILVDTKITARLPHEIENSIALLDISRTEPTNLSSVTLEPYGRENRASANEFGLMFESIVVYYIHSILEKTEKQHKIVAATNFDVTRRNRIEIGERKTRQPDILFLHLEDLNFINLMVDAKSGDWNTVKEQLKIFQQIQTERKKQGLNEPDFLIISLHANELHNNEFDEDLRPIVLSPLAFLLKLSNDFEVTFDFEQAKEIFEILHKHNPRQHDPEKYLSIYTEIKSRVQDLIKQKFQPRGEIKL